jgi:hypothetical protein
MYVGSKISVPFSASSWVDTRLGGSVDEADDRLTDDAAGNRHASLSDRFAKFVSL